MSNFDRRKLFQLGLGGLASGMTLSGYPILRAMERAAGMAATPNGDSQKLLLIFMRGGTDGVLAVIPQGDTTYAPSRNIGSMPPFIPAAATGLPGASLRNPLSSYAELNPGMRALLQGPMAAGDVALLHQVGNPLGGRSHFTEMARMETASPALGAAQLPENGFVPGISTALGLPGNTSLGTVSVSKLMQRMFQSVSNPQLHVRDVPQFRALAFDPDVQAHLLGTPAGAVEQIVDGLGDLMVAAQMELANAPPFVHDGARFPSLPSDPWDDSLLLTNPNPQAQAFFRDLEGAVHLLKNTGCRVAGVELGGFDTHSDELQSGPAGLNQLLALISFGLNSAWEVAPWITSLAMSEFGRGALANGNNGTDHGVGGVMIACGSAVKKGVYNCSPATWTPLATQGALPTSNALWNAVPVRTHYLTVFDEILDKLFLLSSTDRKKILPGLSGVTGLPATRLGFM